MTLRAIDFDGLILDTEWPEYLSIAEVYEQHGLEIDVASWRDRVGTVSGDWLTELEERVGGIDFSAAALVVESAAVLTLDTLAGLIERDEP